MKHDKHMACFSVYNKADMTDSIQYLRLKRQNLIERGSAEEYEKLFRLMSPVPTLFWTTPGEPPVIQYRTGFDDRAYNNGNRSDRTIIKGRFRGGSVGYIYSDELPLFMAAYKKEISRFSENDNVVLETLRSEGAMNIEMIKEITGLLSKHISASLQKLQKAFIVFEDQVDSEWDRSWYILEDEFSDRDFCQYTKEEAVREVIMRFAHLNVFFDETMVKSFTRLSQRDIKNGMASLTATGKLVHREIAGKSGYILAEDEGEIESCRGEIPDKTYILDLNDYLVRSNESELKGRYNPEPYKTLHYIMRRGEIIGIIAGRFSFGPNELEDVRLDVGGDEKKRYLDSIGEALGTIYDPLESPLQRFCGERL